MSLEHRPSFPLNAPGPCPCPPASSISLPTAASAPRHLVSSLITIYPCLSPFTVFFTAGWCWTQKRSRINTRVLAQSVQASYIRKGFITGLLKCARQSWTRVAICQRFGWAATGDNVHDYCSGIQKLQTAILEMTEQDGRPFLNHLE